MKRLISLLALFALCAAAQAQEARIRTQTLIIAPENEKQRIEITWPQISGLSDLDAQDRVNGNLFTLFFETLLPWGDSDPVDKIYAQIEADQSQEKPLGDSLAVVIIPDYEPDIPVIMQLDSLTYPRVLLNRDGLLSMGCAAYLFTGGAHGMSYWQYRLYDLNTGEAYSLDDLFIEGYENRLDALVDDLVPREDLFSPDEPVKMEDGAEWFISEDGFTAQFGLYAIGPRAAGLIEATIPFEDLVELMKPDSPLRRLMNR